MIFAAVREFFRQKPETVYVTPTLREWFDDVMSAMAPRDQFGTNPENWA